MIQTYRVTWTVYGVPHAKTVKGPLLSILRNLQESEENIMETMTQLEKEKVINGYHTVINWERANVDRVSALIEVSCQPERDYGYDRIASMIYSYSEVETMYLMSGKSEFIVMVEGKTMQEISNFVGAKLAVVEGVTGTNTNFVLKKYKTAGIILSDNEDDEDDRMVVMP